MTVVVVNIAINHLKVCTNETNDYIVVFYFYFYDVLTQKACSVTRFTLEYNAGILRWFSCFRLFDLLQTFCFNMHAICFFTFFLNAICTMTPIVGALRNIEKG